VPGGECGAGQLDHGADRQVELDTGLGGHLGEHAFDLLPHDPQLLDGSDERHHDLRPRVTAGADTFGDRFGDGPDLGRAELGDHQAEPYAAQTEHRVLFEQPPDCSEQPVVVLVRRLGSRSCPFGGVSSR
jgi:hypothetical protein